MTTKQYVLIIGTIIISACFLFFLTGYKLSKTKLELEKFNEVKKIRKPSIDINNEIPSQVDTFLEFSDDAKEKLNSMFENVPQKRKPSKDVEKRKGEFLENINNENQRSFSDYGYY